MLRHTSLTLDRIAHFSKRFFPLIYPERIPLQARVSGPVSRISYQEAQKLHYREAKIGMVLKPFWATFWFRLKGRVPSGWKGRRVDLYWISHSEAQLWRQGEPVQGLNFEPSMAFNSSVRPDAKLFDKARGGEEVSLQVEVACNRVFGYQTRELVPYKTLSPFVFENADLALFDQEAWDMYFDYLILSDLVAKAKPQSLTPWEGYLISRLNEVANICVPEDRSTWPGAKKILKEIYRYRNPSYQHEISAIGHAHIDTAWLWPIAETKRKCARTFSSTLAYMEDYPEYRFSCSQAQQYEWIKEEYPSLYRKIRGAIQKGQWVPVGGTWIEPDCNVPSGESLVRQFLIGKNFFRKEFNFDCKEFWNPDVFGYSGALPQIMKGVGIDYFLTQKLSWNQFNKPMHHTFHWEGIDGTRVLTHFPPADTYNAMAGRFPLHDLLHSSTNFKDHDRSNQSMLLYGLGDGGGGPTRGMLETLRRVKDLQGVPRTQQRSSREFFTRLEQNIQDVPVVKGELYFELHRGTYTTQAENKKLNRECEFLLRDVEWINTMAWKLRKARYPSEPLLKLWKVLLLDQFHDIIPGSSIREVYEDTASDYRMILAEGQKLREKGIRALSSGNSRVVMNSCGWDRNALLEVPGIQTSHGQKSYRGNSLVQVRLPSMGVTPLNPVPIKSSGVKGEFKGGRSILENDFLKAEFSKEGLLVRLFDKINRRVVVQSGAPANQFVLFDDRPNRWDAWDVDAFHLETRRPLPSAKGVRLIEKGPLRAGLEIRWGFHPSSMVQRVFLNHDSKQLEFECDVDWKHRHQFLKVEFPVNVRSEEAAYEIQFGYVKRPTHFNTTFDIARFESCGHKWIDLSQPDYGVALMTDSKYGYAVHESVMRISLLRAPTYPDPEADQGKHSFRFAFYPHAGTFLEAGVTRRAYEFNCPPILTRGEGQEHSWFSVDRENLILDTVKQAEDSNGVIVRLYEAHGVGGTSVLSTSLPFKKAVRTNLMEEGKDWEAVAGGKIRFSYRPFEVITLRLS